MKLPPLGSHVRVVWVDASSDPRGWHYIDNGPLHEARQSLSYFTDGVYVGTDEGRMCVAPSVVIDEDNNVVAAGDRWWIPVGCIVAVETAKFKVFSTRERRKPRKGAR